MPARATTGTIESSTDLSFNVAGDPVSVAFDVGTEDDLLLLAWVSWYVGTSVTIATPTQNTVAMTPLGAAITQGSLRKQGFYLVAPTTGDFSVDPSAGFSAPQTAMVELLCYSGVDQASPITNYVTNQGADASGSLDSTLTLTGSSGGLLVTSHSAHSAGVTGGTATGFTERLDNIVDSGSQDLGSVAGDAADAASTNTTVAFAGGFSINSIAMGVRLAPVVVGPTIDTQPQSATVRLSEGTSQVFTIAATTSGGTLVRQWKVDGVAAGTDANSFTLTGITIDDDGTVVTCEVSDDNGTTISANATLSVLAGTTIVSSDTDTDSDGVATLVFTSDDPLTDEAEFLQIPVVAGGLSLSVCVSPATP